MTRRASTTSFGAAAGRSGACGAARSGLVRRGRLPAESGTRRRSCPAARCPAGLAVVVEHDLRRRFELELLRSRRPVARVLIDLELRAHGRHGHVTRLDLHLRARVWRERTTRRSPCRTRRIDVQLFDRSVEAFRIEIVWRLAPPHAVTSASTRMTNAQTRHARILTPAVRRRDDAYPGLELESTSGDRAERRSDLRRERALDQRECAIRAEHERLAAMPRFVCISAASRLPSSTDQARSAISRALTWR